ncbi:MAG: type I restriction-modification enzyme R subunit C-terminal domain-containing protein [Nitrincola lacisaponensis]|uniref:type I restriction-modification enzyme R subunit C-terminal domain-containing protein n=1 Tax=Nitrincola lacisaponensis TaxID=267850 RepID=UPI0039196936
MAQSIFEEKDSNRAFLSEYDPLFLQLLQNAERVFCADPNTILIKLRQFSEAIAQEVTARSGVEFDAQTTQADLLYKLNRELGFELQVRELLHILCIEGNKTTHQFKTLHRESLDGLKVARALAVWFHQAFDQAGTQFKAGLFIALADPSSQLQQLHQDIEKLKAELEQANVQLGTSQKLHELVAQAKAAHEALALAMDEEAKHLVQQAALHEAVLKRQQQEYEAKIQQLQQHSFNPSLRKRLERLAKQLVPEVVVDRAFVRNYFANDGGAKRFNLVLEGQLDTVLVELCETLWQAC